MACMMNGFGGRPALCVDIVLPCVRSLVPTVGLENVIDDRIGTCASVFGAADLRSTSSYGSVFISRRQGRGPLH